MDIGEVLRVIPGNLEVIFGTTGVPTHTREKESKLSVLLRDLDTGGEPGTGRRPLRISRKVAESRERKEAKRRKRELRRARIYTSVAPEKKRVGGGTKKPGLSNRLAGPLDDESSLLR